MAKKLGIKQATEFMIGLARLAFIAVGAGFLFVLILLAGNLLLYGAAQITESLFDLLRNLFGE